jgi:hypothetical protein
MTLDENKLEILKKVEDGTLSVEEGSELLGILDSGVRSMPQPKVVQHQHHIEEMSEPAEPYKVSGCWKAAWSMILLGGAVLTAFSAFWVYQGYQSKGFGWGFWLSWIPLVVGVLITILGWALMESPWLHVRVHSEEDEKNVNIVFSIPIPLGLMRWFFRTFGSRMPEEVHGVQVLEMLDELEASLKRGEPFHIQVDDEKDKSKVEIFTAT